MPRTADADFQHALREPLRQLMHVLIHATHEHDDDANILGRVDMVLRRHGRFADEAWPEVLDDLLRAEGLRAAWRESTTTDAAAGVHPCLPAFTRSGAGFVVLERDSARVTARNVPGGPTRGLPDDAVRTWAFVEPALPYTILGDHHLSPRERLIGLLRSEARDLKALTLYALAVGLLGLATPVTIQVVVNQVAFGVAAQPLWFMLMLLAVCLGIIAGLRVLERYIVELIQRRMFARMVTDMAERLPRWKAEVFDHHRPEELVHRFFDILILQKATASVLLEGLDALFQALVAMVLLALYHPTLLGFDLVLLAMFFGVYWLGRGAVDSAILESKRKYKVAAWLQEVAVRADTFRTDGGAAWAAERADALTRDWLRDRSAHFSIFLRQYGAMTALQAVATTALLAVGGSLVLERQLSLGQLVAAEFIVTSALVGIAKLTDKFDAFYDLLASVDKIGHLVEVPLEPADGRPYRPLGGPVLALAEVDARLAALRLTGSLSVAEGTTTTVTIDDPLHGRLLVDLVLGEREPASGRVLIEGQDIHEMRLGALRRAVAAVRSEALVTGSLVDNVRMGRPEVHLDEIRRVLWALGVEATREELEETVEESGLPWSVTDRVRVALARAVVGQPAIIVIDRVLDVLVPDEGRRLLHALRTVWHGPLLVVTCERTLATGALLHIVDGRITEVTGA